MTDRDKYDEAKDRERRRAELRDPERPVSIPFAMSEFAFKRTEPLALEANWRPIRNVAADCYLQGIRDAVQASVTPPTPQEGMKHE